jgi:hypothetical protein
MWGALDFAKRTPCLVLLVVQLARVFYIAMVVTRLVALRGQRSAARAERRSGR